MTNGKTLYSFACATFAASVACASLAGCFSERVTQSSGPSGQELCNGTQPNVVRVRDFAFSPATLQVSPGTTVTWVNCDGVTHSSTSDAELWDQTLGQFATYQRTFDAAGRFDYHCEPHPSMRAAVVVQ